MASNHERARKVKADRDVSAQFPTCTVYEGTCTTEDKATSGAAVAPALAVIAVALVSLTVFLL